MFVLTEVPLMASSSVTMLVGRSASTSSFSAGARICSLDISFWTLLNGKTCVGTYHQQQFVRSQGWKRDNIRVLAMYTKDAAKKNKTA